MKVQEKWKEQYFSSTYSIYSIYCENVIPYAFGEHDQLRIVERLTTFTAPIMLKHDWKHLNENSTPDLQG